MAQGIGVNREVSATSGNGSNYPPRTTTPAYSAPRPWSSSQQRKQHFTLARTRPRAKSASNLLIRPSQDIQFHDDTLIDQQDPVGRQDGLAELIDFLRNHSPPSSNLMSIPDDIDDADRGRWYRLRKLGKRSKSLSRSPQTIQLPDSAVSGITIGGHRHIAISIPLDASPFGRTPRSQYPVYQHRSVKPLTSRYAPTRAVLNDKGVVTVLRTVTEDRETSSSTSPAETQRPMSMSGQRPQSTTLGRAYSPDTINSNSFGKASVYFNVPTTPPRVLSPDQVRQANDQSREFQQYDQGGPRPASSNQRDGLGSRNSSFTATRFVHPGTSSIDAMMSQPITTTLTPLSLNRPVSQDGSHQPSPSKSTMATGENESVVAETKPVEAAQRPVAKESWPRASTKKPEEPPVTVITNSPLGNSQETLKKPSTKDENSPTPSVQSSKSRRDKVRDKKRRDMEASLKRRSQLFNTAFKDEPDRDERTKESSEEKGEEEQPPPVPLRSPQRQSICPIMIVANVQPSPPPSSRLPDTPKRLPKPSPNEATESSSTPEPQASSKLTHENTSKRAVSPSPGVYMNGSSNPTPPQSAHGSPAHKQIYDRTSLSRRREWNAAREEERKFRETKARLSPRAKARKLVMPSEEGEESKVPPMEKEVLRRYEAYREYRIREMERRVRRLERNGDVWLRALVPVLDNLNRTLANVHEEQPHRAQGWVSDDETGNRRGPQMRPSRQGSRGRMMARPGISEREFLEQLVRTKEELEAGSVSDDMSGFDTIEPLMRELAGRSRLSFEARSLGVGSDDDGVLRAFST
ncbi:hypothetical protein FALBO_743 [Fusarium albosuccineum]|uniref:Uncharacterized protein n=1 Tax=Fusarium albosuccineum TaxID=1237068 RepID=A0A8H4PE78_9HYPO|nr:hypothetical protein FALBO_743 [Fusarium albosuccineum]